MISSAAQHHAIGDTRTCKPLGPHTRDNVDRTMLCCAKRWMSIARLRFCWETHANGCDLSMCYVVRVCKRMYELCDTGQYGSS